MNQETLTDERDGHVYITVGIKTQMWMAENLNYADSANYPSMLERNWCYDNDEENCIKYGRLYMWSAAIDSVYWSKLGKTCGYDEDLCSLPDKVQGICPTGWHVPNFDEFQPLFAAVGGCSTSKKICPAGKMLKSQMGWNNINGSNGNGTDAYGFSALPAGGRGDDGDFHFVGYDAFFWSATEYKSNASWYMTLAYHDIEPVFYDTFNNKSSQNGNNKYNAFSVRCVKDEE